MLKGGFVKIHRKIVDWEWYHDATVSRVFLHLLFIANYESYKFEGLEIKPGQCVISLQKVAETLSLSKDSVDRALKKLEKSGELQRKPTAKFTIITLKNYTLYQQSATEADRLPTASRPQADPMEERKRKIKKDKEIKKEGSACALTTPSPSITFDSLISEFGEMNVDAYKTKVKNWQKKKGIKGEPTAEIVGKWLTEDRAKLKMPAEVNFDVTELEKQAYERYKRKKGEKNG